MCVALPIYLVFLTVLYFQTWVNFALCILNWKYSVFLTWPLAQTHCQTELRKQLGFFEGVDANVYSTGHNLGCQPVPSPLQSFRTPDSCRAMAIATSVIFHISHVYSLMIITTAKDLALRINHRLFIQTRVGVAISGMCVLYIKTNTKLICSDHRSPTARGRHALLPWQQELPHASCTV